MKKRLAVAAILAVVSTNVSAHVVRGLFYPTLATAFVSSPTGTADSPVPIAWGTQVTGLRVACFFACCRRSTRGGNWSRVSMSQFRATGRSPSTWRWSRQSTRWAVR